MSIIVGYTPTPQGEAALQHAIVEARTHGHDLVLVNVSPVSEPRSSFATDEDVARVRAALDPTGLRYSIRQLVRGKDVADEIVGMATELSAALVVIGLRHRTPVGKLLLGSNSQRILLESPCPVTAVKAPHRRRDAGPSSGA
ncbi:universal stress protein [Actinotalea sp. K2]|uniref:universal stress protein n=1 Tax=Actinotalea sp. K2 TaxID=2939438 RepID=UPI002017F17A|nr:universal stress protein [Actinotalea sp. K2]MCL3863186.1 universal stress protein [Actinotalea sp. K2]